MKGVALAAALALAACGDHPAVVIDRPVLVVPEGLRDCPVPPIGIPAPQPPRSLESLLAWIRIEEGLRRDTQTIAITCRKRLRELAELVGEARK